MKANKVFMLIISIVLLGVLLVACNDNDTTPTHQHIIVIDDAVSPTCTSTGLTDGSHCSECGEVVSAQKVVDKAAHILVKDAGLEPTCTSTGLSEGAHCSACGEVIVAQVSLSKEPHIVIIDAAVESTCDKAGLTAGAHCSECGEVLIAQSEVSPKAHTYDDKYDAFCNVCGYERDADCAHSELETIPGKSANCVSEGLTDGKKCAKCGEIIVAQNTIAKAEHTIVIDKEVPADCINTGLTAGTHCSECQAVFIKQEIIPVSEVHTYDDRYDAVCNVCGYTRDVSCPHLFIETVPAKAATCTETGLTEGQSCSECGEIIIAQEIVEKIPHTEGEWIIDKDPTASETGKKRQVCAVCGETLIEVTVPVISALEYTVNSDGISCTITGIRSISDQNLYIPEYIDGYKVTGIGEKAFADQAQLTAIIIPETVNTIGARAFYGCTGLTEMTIPGSVTSIGTQIFYKTSNLSTVYYNSTYSNPSNAFLAVANITKVVFGGKYIPNYILENYSNVKEVVIKEGITSISVKAFSGCSSLTSIVIPDSVTSIEDSAFRSCSSLTSIVIPGSITSIGDSAFRSCSGLTSIVIPDSVASIGDCAFQDCSSLTTITIGNGVTSIGESAFYSCRRLTNVYITDIMAWCEIDYDYFFSYSYSNPMCNGAKLYLNGELVTDLVIPDSVTSIEDGTFSGCSSLTSIVIPDSVTSIGDYAFWDCSSLTSIVIPDSVASIGASTFSGCSSLTSIVIPDSVMRIGERAFYRCSNLTSIVISNSVTSIGGSLFYGCSSLTSIVIPDSVTSIMYAAFEGCSSLTSIVIPDSVTNIGNSAFSGCSSLTSIVIADSVTSIGSQAFHECRSLTSITFEGTIAQWNAVTKGSYWDSGTGAYTVYCTDGNITK